MYSYLSNIYPQKVRESFYLMLTYFNFSVRREFILGSFFFFILGVSLSISFQFSKKFIDSFFLSFLPYSIGAIFSFIFTFIASFVILHFFVYSVLLITATNRGQFVEKVLPDALELISANLRSGLTIERALIAANRKEFGYLNHLLTVVGKEISTGTEIGEALIDATKKVKSEKFEKTIELIVMAMRSGGELSRLLGQVAENLVHQKNIEDKVKAGVSTFLIFIGAAVAFAAPFLYGLSSVFVKIMVSSFSGIEIPAQANVPFALKVSEEMAEFLPTFVKIYAMVSLSTLGIMASFLLGLIKKGKAKFGITYVPFLVGFSLLTYLLVSKGADLLFQSIA